MLEGLKKNCEFQYVYQNGKSYANKYLVMYQAKNNCGKSRIGFSVSKKVGNSVVRHRIVRLLRESVRLNSEKFETGYDIVIVARISAKGRTFQEISDAVLHLGRLQKILK